MISKKDYLGIYANCADITPTVEANIYRLLSKVNALIQAATLNKIPTPINIKTRNQISGEANGGFRPQDCKVGAPNSLHKQGLAIDLYDPTGALDNWVNEPKQAKLIESLGLYFEHKDYTQGWVHVQLNPPKSGKRFYIP